MSFIVRKKIAGPVVLDDLGFTIVGAINFDYNFALENANDVHLSANGGDLQTRIAAGDLVVIDPRDDVTELNIADSLLVAQNHNTPHYGIVGGRINDIDDIDTTGANPGDVLTLSGGTWIDSSVSSILAGANLDDLGDVDDPTAHTNGTTYVFVGDGTNLDVVDATTDVNFAETIQDIIGATLVDGTSTTVVYTDAGVGTGTVQVNVDDDFIANNGGDTFGDTTPGTWTVASGSNITIANGGDLIITDPPVNPTDATNKAYVDSVSAGLDPKESVRVATTPAEGDIGGTYNSTGGTGGSGEFTGVDLSGGNTIDGLNYTGSTATGLADGDRILIKDQTNDTEQGIYVIVSGPANNVTLERSSDQDGTPANEVSGGNFTYVEDTTAINATSVNSNQGWVVAFDGQITLNTDDVDWVQFSGAGSFTSGIGISQIGNLIDLDVNDLVVASIVSTDFLAFHDGDGVAEASGSITRKITAANFISDLNILTSVSGGALSASDGVRIDTGGATDDIQLDINNLGTEVLQTADLMVFHNDSDTGNHIQRSITNFLADLDIPNAIATNGIVVRTAADTYASRSITVNGAGALDGLAVTNGDGVAGDPTLGLDIQNLPARSDAIDSVDRVAVWNSTVGANEYYTVGEIATALAAVNSFETWAGAGNTSGDASIVADSSTDTVTVTGGIGINVDLTSASDIITWAFTRAGMADTAVASTDTVPFFDGSNSDEPEYRAWGDLFDDLDVPNDIGSGTGIVVKTGDSPDTYTTRTITTNGVGNLDGLAVVDGDGVAGNPTIGLDILNNVDAGEDLAAADEFIIYNLSATANEAITGQEVADGVSTILNLSSLTTSTINGQPIVTIEDSTRANKVLSVDSNELSFGENSLVHLDWVRPAGNAVDADAGYIAPLQGTVVWATGHCENANTNSKDIHLFINGVDNGSVGTLSGAANVSFTNTTLNVDFVQGDRIRLQAQGSGTGNIEDTVCSVHIKWRA